MKDFSQYDSSVEASTNESRSMDSSRVNVNSFLISVYNWMILGLLVTAATAYGVKYLASQGLFSGGVFVFSFFAQFAIVFTLSSFISKLSATTAKLLFLAYSVLSGVTFSIILVAYSTSSLATVFVITASTFAFMSLYGATTKKDLTSMGTFMMVGLFGIIIAMIVNFFLKSPAVNYVISCIGVIVFVGLTAYDTQKLKELGESAPIDDTEAVGRGVILGALTLYLDFINLFIFLLRLIGSNRE